MEMATKFETQQVMVRNGAGETWRCDGEEYVVAVANPMVRGHQPVIANFKCSPATMVRVVAMLTHQGKQMYGESFTTALEYVLKAENFDVGSLS